MTIRFVPSRLVPLAAAVLLLAACGSDPEPQPGANGSGNGTPATSEPPTEGTADGSAQADADPAPVPGLVTYTSRFGVEETVQRLSDGLSAVGMVVATVDHAANAQRAGQQLRPTVLIVGGNPEAGTPLMVDEQEAGINLPQRFLVWEDAAGTVWLGYNDASYIAELADVDRAVAQGLAGASARLAAQATGSEQPARTGPGAGDDDYLRERDSVSDVPSSLQRLQDSLTAQGLRPAAVVDHAQGAETIGATLPPTTVLLVGNPEAGTPLIQASQTMGLDLPLRFLVWRGEDGAGHVAYPDIARLAQRHGIPGDDPAVQRIARAAEGFATAAAGRGG